MSGGAAPILRGIMMTTAQRRATVLGMLVAASIALVTACSQGGDDGPLATSSVLTTASAPPSAEVSPSATAVSAAPGVGWFLVEVAVEPDEEVADPSGFGSSLARAVDHRFLLVDPSGAVVSTSEGPSVEYSSAVAWDGSDLVLFRADASGSLYPQGGAVVWSPDSGEVGQWVEGVAQPAPLRIAPGVVVSGHFGGESTEFDAASSLQDAIASGATGESGAWSWGEPHDASVSPLGRHIITVNYGADAGTSHVVMVRTDGAVVADFGTLDHPVNEYTHAGWLDETRAVLVRTTSSGPLAFVFDGADGSITPLEMPQGVVNPDSLIFIADGVLAQSSDGVVFIDSSGRSLPEVSCPAGQSVAFDGVKVSGKRAMVLCAGGDGKLGSALWVDLETGASSDLGAVAEPFVSLVSAFEFPEAMA